MSTGTRSRFQLQATRRASEASEWEQKDAKTEALLVPRHGVTLTPARPARLPPPRRRQSLPPVLAPPRDASGVSARQPEGTGVQTKTFRTESFKGNTMVRRAGTES